MSVKYTKEARKQFILQNRLKFDNKGLSKETGVTERTIDRDIRELKNEGLYWAWAHEGFIELFREGDIDDSTKFKELNKIQLKEITDKHQVEATGDMVFRLEAWRPDDDDSADTVPPP